MNRRICKAALAAALGVSLNRPLEGAVIDVINPGGEAYTAAGTIQINPGGVAPIETTGWNSMLAATAGVNGAESLTNNPASGLRRLSVGATDASTVAADDFALFQETSRIAAEGDRYSLEFLGRAFFQFNAGTDVQMSLFGFLDGAGGLVSVDAKGHTTTVSNVWTAAVPHVFTVPAGSPLIGENLVIGFFTDTPDVEMGGFTAVDDVVLTLVPEPAASILCLIGVLVGIGALGRARRQ